MSICQPYQRVAVASGASDDGGSFIRKYGAVVDEPIVPRRGVGDIGVGASSARAGDAASQVAGSAMVSASRLRFMAVSTINRRAREGVESPPCRFRRKTGGLAANAAPQRATESSGVRRALPAAATGGYVFSIRGRFARLAAWRITTTGRPSAAPIGGAF
jgi:hypothetical protein